MGGAGWPSSAGRVAPSSGTRAGGASLGGGAARCGRASTPPLLRRCLRDRRGSLAAAAARPSGLELGAASGPGMAARLERPRLRLWREAPSSYSSLFSPPPLLPAPIAHHPASLDAGTSSAVRPVKAI
ncbi:hypothetical protein C2845_PM01G40630 [Panicum miliaceum]|uniref:Uncharacterized protein n=1 Tax=Panicum miliaceum TaxID=4540 RepID=A0A3L6TI28_PANMI|nr:hypothetical protein C2845_PM01G40630 [Panicum miliaceum]